MLKGGDKIEICIPVFQRPQRVPVLLNNFNLQTEQDFNINIWNNSGEELDTGEFPEDRLLIVSSNRNLGSQARFFLVPLTKGNIIIFLDDDIDILPNFIEFYYKEYCKHGSNVALGWWTRRFDKESYFDCKMGKPNEEVDYIATNGMILNRKVFDEEAILYNMSDKYAQVEDLFLSYLLREKYNTKLITIKKMCKVFHDSKDQFRNLRKYKQIAFENLRDDGWKLLREFKKFRKFKVHDKEILVDTTFQKNDVLNGGFLRNGTFYESDLLNFTKDLSLPENKVIVDVGANIGNHTLFFSLFCPCYKVFAFEPYGKVRKVLESNISLNNLENVEVFPFAVGDKEGRCSLEKSPLNKNGVSQDGMTYVKEGDEVKMVTLDKVLRGKKVSLIKIDVESFEIKVLRGAKNILRTQHPFLFIEAKTTEEKKTIDEFLGSFGYSAKKIFHPVSPTYFYKSKFN